MRKVLLMLVILMTTIPGYLLAQQSNVSGKVVDEQGNPIPFASIAVKGTSLGASANEQGIFKISASANQVLVVSATGYSSKDVIASNAGIITLVSAGHSEDEIIVVAYGQQKKSSLTGAVNKISAKDLEDRLTTNISQALAGAAPGIQTTSGNGQPGSSAAVRIRGFGSLSASNSPLYVVDGFPYDGFIGDISTNDIESITLLKDATSAALYGSRAANGVILITTKKGSIGKPKVNVNLLTGFSKRGIPEYETANIYEYYPLYWQAYRNNLVYGSGIDPTVAAQRASNEIGPQLVYNPFNVARESLVDVNGNFNPNAQLLYNDFDWFKAMENNGPRNEVNFNISAKSNGTDYFVSLGYIKDNGYLIKSDFERVTARMNITSQITGWFKTGLNMSGAVVKSNQASATGDNTFINPFVFARGIGPIYPIHAWDAQGQPIIDPLGNQYYDYGSYPGAVNRPNGASPGRHIVYETLLNTNLNRRNSMTGRAFYELKFLKDFTFTHNIGIDLSNTKETTIQNKIVGDGVTLGGYASRGANEYKTVTMNQLLNYKKKIGVHSLAVLVGHENSWLDNIYFSGSKNGANLDGNIEFTNYVTNRSVSGYSIALRREAYLGKFNYDFDDKYFLDLSFRRDGSSKFSPKSRWGNFWSAGGAWHLNKENFLKGNNVISDLKLRAAYGTVGNDGVLKSDGSSNYYAYQQLYELGWNNGGAPGALASSLRNDDLTWEVGTNFTTGVDIGLFKNRVTATIEFFKRGSSSLLFDVPLGQSAIVTSITRNIGSMQNTGVEFSLGADLVKTDNVKWNINFMLTTLKNKITKLPDGKPITSGTKRLEEGNDLYAFYLRKWWGVDPSNGAAYYIKDPVSTTTDYKIVNSDTLVANPTNAVFAYAGSAIPKFFGSFTNTISYKGLSLSFLLNYQIGGKFYDGNYAGLMTIGSYGKSLHKDLINAWRKEGDITNIPRLDIAQSTNFNSQSDRFLIDASYLAIRNATVAYNLPATLLSRINFNAVKVFVTGENLLMKSKRVGLNPMESFSGTNSPVYTPNRIISVGVNFGF